jgi:hypothetical protein
MGGNVLKVGGKGSNGTISVAEANDVAVIELIAFPQEATIAAGQSDHPGRLKLFNGQGLKTVDLIAKEALFALGGGDGAGGLVSVRHSDGVPAVELIAYPEESTIGAGAPGRPGRLKLFNDQGKGTVDLIAQDATFALGGGDGAGGLVSVRHSDGVPAVELIAYPEESTIGAGAAGRPGRLKLFNDQGEQTVDLIAAEGNLVLGGNGVDGFVSLRGSDNLPLIELIGSPDACVMGLGQLNRPGRISVFSADQNESVTIDGASGDILIANADCAEEFDMAVAEIEPGTVVVLTDSGGLAPSESPYDTRVAGIVSGAGSYRPGLVLDRRSTGSRRAPVALLGKVYCRVDASETPVRIGDLLTTSSRAGHAMRASDPLRAFGAVLGKALAPLPSGSGLIPVLVTLQ